MCGKKEISEDNGPKYATFPDKECCKKSECAFFEETPDGQNDRCRCKKMAGKLLTVRLKKNGSNDRLCPCWGDKSLLHI